MEDNNKPHGLQIDLPQAIATGEYVNFALINHSSSDFVLDFASILPGLPKAIVRNRVIMAPEHAKRLLLALQDNIRKYEAQYGPIRLPDAQGSTIAPFYNGKGEA